MPVHWSKKPGAAPHLAVLDHGLWRVSVPGRAHGEVELAYVRRDGDGRLPGTPLPVGAFSAAAEAMLLVELYESGTAPGPVADRAAARGFAGRGSELVLVLPGWDECVLEVGPDAVSLAFHGDTPARVGRMCRPRPQGDFVAFERPPGIEDPEALDAAALLDILDIRRARGPSGVREPATMEEFEAWRRTRARDPGRRSDSP